MATLQHEPDSSRVPAPDTRVACPLEWMRSLPAPSRKDLPITQWAVLTRLALAMNADGTGFVSLDRLARETGAEATSTAKRAVGWAITNRWLVRTARGHHVGAGHGVPSSYRLLLPENRP